MTKYIAFLRAINVGGKSIIKMDDLRKIFESFRLENVQTYIQTGNVIFESKEKDASLLEKKIESQLEKAVGYNVNIFLRTIQEVTVIAEQCPFTPKESETIHIAFLREKPDKKTSQALLNHNSEADEFIVNGREAYNLRHDRDASIFSNNFIEKTLGIPATTRNLTTVKKIAEKYR
jgi:uncharacterized protein (DUF1697 family)